MCPAATWAPRGRASGQPPWGLGALVPVEGETRGFSVPMGTEQVGVLAEPPRGHEHPRAGFGRPPVGLCCPPETANAKFRSRGCL